MTVQAGSSTSMRGSAVPNQGIPWRLFRLSSRCPSRSAQLDLGSGILLRSVSLRVNMDIVPLILVIVLLWVRARRSLMLPKRTDDLGMGMIVSMGCVRLVVTMDIVPRISVHRRRGHPMRLPLNLFLFLRAPTRTVTIQAVPLPVVSMVMRVLWFLFLLLPFSRYVWGYSWLAGFSVEQHANLDD